MARNAIERGLEFDLPGGPDAVLLLHGLTGSTFELHHVARRLHAAGMRCLAPVMAGHGGRGKDLAGVRWAEWVGKAERDLERLAGGRRTAVVGCSMGALVACALAHDHPERVDGLVLLAPALRLQPQGLLAALLGRLPGLRAAVIPKAAGSDVRDAEMKRRNPGLDGVPLGAVSELAALAAHVDRILPGIAAPALVIQGAHDHTVSPAGARRVAERIGSGPAELVILPETYHLAGIDVERDRCAEVALRFLEALPTPQDRGASAGAGAGRRRAGAERRGAGRPGGRRRRGGRTRRRTR